MKIRNVLVTTDFSKLSRVAYSRAAFFAQQHEARIHLLHVVQLLPPHCYLSSRPPPVLPKGSFYDGIDSQLRKEAQHSDFAGVNVEPHLSIEAAPDEALTRYAKDKGIDIIVIATHGRTGLSHMILGSFAEKVVRTSPVPVLSIHAGSPPDMPPRRVLVPFDFSTNARAVFPHLQWLSSEYSTEFEFAYVKEMFYPFQDGASVSREIQDWNLHCADRAKEEFARLQTDELAGVNATLAVLDGDPAKELIRVAAGDDVDWIVMATHGWSGLARFFLGSVAEKVVRTAPCTVLTVRPAQIVEGASQKGSSPATA